MIVVFFIASAGAAEAPSYSWRGIHVRQATASDVKKIVGDPTQEYREQLLYENQLFDPNDPNGQSIRLITIVVNIGVKGAVESIFLSPEYGTTDEQLRPFLGKGQKMTYEKFLATFGQVKVGAGTKPDEKLHYIALDAPCEFFPKSRALALYTRQDVVSGGYLVQFLLFY